MAPALRTIVVSHQQTPQPPLRAANAILTVFAVFSFFGVLILLVAGWIRCVEGMDGRLGDSDSICSSSTRKRKGFNDWYHKRRNMLQRRTAATPWRRPTDTKFWQEYERPGEMKGLFRSMRRGSAAYNTFDSQWYRSSPSEEGEDSDGDDSDSEVSASPRTLKFGSRPIMRHRSTDGITAGRLVPKKQKHQLAKTMTAPVKTMRNINNKSHTGQRRKSSIGEDRNMTAKPTKIIRPKRQNSGGSMRSNWSTGRAKILDAVPEETGTGNTPER